MKALDLLATKDNIYSTFMKDSIGRNTDVAAFVSLLNSIDSKMVIALNSGWGGGKTFFIKQVKMILDVLNPNIKNLENANEIKAKWNSLKDKDEIDVQPFVSVYYDAWINDNDEDPILSIVLSVLQEIENLNGLENSRDIIDIASNVLDCLSGRTISGVIKSLRGENPLDNLKKKKDLDSEIKLFFDKILPERGNRIVIFVDELDRCKPDYAIHLLERIKHYFDDEKITFVFAINIDELQHTIRKFYGNNFNACGYLDRFFDFRIELPKPDMSKFYQDMGMDYDSFEYERTCKLVAESLNMGLREFAKFYRMARTIAHNAAHKYESALLFSDGEGRRFYLLYIVPIMIGLSMCDRGRYNSFIQGKDSNPLVDLFKNDWVAKSVFSKLLNDNETYSKNTSNENYSMVTIEEKLEKVYEAIFIMSSDEYYKIDVGKVTFTNNAKKDLLRIVSGLSSIADYEM